ncbi:ribosome maturation factor RimP [Caenibacillus caldisaponilyticus]|uniref:ribosome maturation factor RimP n=1 Tax=Caenibacillus caldisaponilyticus TaxID=1674942 RepID=UPI00098852D3|nr:ribosome maturation factor RimP [Caenibacillus caldisaponilyticus]
MAGKISETVRQLAESVLQDMEVEVLEVKYAKQGKNWVLKVTIDSPEGVDLDLCTRVSERLSDALDEADPIKDPYLLEVTSPGAERPLNGPNDYRRAVGKNVRVTTYEAIGGTNVFEGLLRAVEDEFMTVEVKQKNKVEEVNIPFRLIASARLAIIF